MHGGLSNHVLWMNDALDLTRGDRVLQKTSSASTRRSGSSSRRCAAARRSSSREPDVHQDMRLLAEAIRENDISVVQFVPSELRVMLDELGRGACPRPALCAERRRSDGPRARACRSGQALPGVRLGNFYGPTEATVDSAWYEVGEHLPDRADRADRPSDRQRAALRPRRPAAAPARQRGRRAVRRRARRGARLPQPPRTQRRALRAQSLPARRDACTAPATRRAGCTMAWWSSSGATTTRSSCAAFASNSARSSPRCRACDEVQMSAVVLREVAARPQGAGRLRGAERAGRSHALRVGPEVQAARLHDPERVRVPAGIAAPGQREARSRAGFPALTATASTLDQLAPRSPIESDLAGHLERRAGQVGLRRARELLRSRRAFAARHADRVADPFDPAGRAALAPDLRAPDDRENWRRRSVRWHPDPAADDARRTGAHRAGAAIRAAAACRSRSGACGC